jgi:hypothetical protein
VIPPREDLSNPRGKLAGILRTLSHGAIADREIIGPLAEVTTLCPHAIGGVIQLPRAPPGLVHGDDCSVLIQDADVGA